MIYGAIALASAAVVAVAVVKLAPQKASAPRWRRRRARTLKLQIVTSPGGANVVIGGKKQALLTPYTFEVPWQKSLAVHIERAGYKAYDETLALADGEEARPMNIELVASSQPGGRLTVRANSRHVKLDARRQTGRRRVRSAAARRRRRRQPHAARGGQGLCAAAGVDRHFAARARVARVEPGAGAEQAREQARRQADR